MSPLLPAVACAVLAACCFAAGIHLQHDSVQASGSTGRLSVAGLWRVVRTRRWLTGALLAASGCGLHVAALAMAPLVVVQPIGVLSLVLAVVFGSGPRGRSTHAAVIAVCAGTAGFVVLAAGAASSASSVVDAGNVQVVVLVALAVAALGAFTRGRGRCLVLAAAAAMLFGLGAALIRATATDVLDNGIGLGAAALGAESAALVLCGGWLLQQAFTSGPPAIVIGATTVIDPMTAVAVGVGLYGEAAGTDPVRATAQIACAVLAVAGVAALVRSTPERSRPVVEPAELHPTGLRVLIGADTFPPDVNGAANFTDRLARGLARRGHDVHVVCPSATGRPTTESDGEITTHRLASFRTPVHPTFRVCAPWHVSREVPRLLAAIRPDVVHVQAHFAVGRRVLRSAVAQRLSVIATNHFMPENLLGYGPVPRVLRAAVTRWAWRDLIRVYRQAPVVTTPTPRAAELLHANGLHPKAWPISCGIDLDRFAGVTPRGTSVLFVGRLDREKNVDELLRAVAAAPDLRAEIVGEGVCHAELAQLADELGVADRVRFHGFVPDDELLGLYQRCAVFCMPGTAELQSIATMEAMAAGLPVVAVDAMALPHLVRDGVNGFLYQPGDVAGLARALSALTADPVTRAAMGSASRELISGHDLRHTLDAFEDAYLEAIYLTGADSTAHRAQALAR